MGSEMISIFFFLSVFSHGLDITFAINIYSKKKYCHTQTHTQFRQWIQGWSVAQTENFWSSLSSLCYKWAPWGPEKARFGEGLNWLNRIRWKWIPKRSPKGPLPFKRYHVLTVISYPVLYPLTKNVRGWRTTVWVKSLPHGWIGTGYGSHLMIQIITKCTNLIASFSILILVYVSQTNKIYIY